MIVYFPTTSESPIIKQTYVGYAFFIIRESPGLLAHISSFIYAVFPQTYPLIFIRLTPEADEPPGPQEVQANDSFTVLYLRIHDAIKAGEIVSDSVLIQWGLPTCCGVWRMVWRLYRSAISSTRITISHPLTDG